jgi:uroporphyrin-III C-methyltransferase
LLFGHVVRLKGGDPFVFGRGGEEMQSVRDAGIEVSIIPGISSSIGVPGNVGIPVTHRGLSESFWVLTATNQNGDLANDIYKAAQTKATAVILMGLNKLAEIVQLYGEYNPLDLPIAVIQDGTLPTQKVVTGSLENIVGNVIENKVKSPAIIIIGKVVSLYKEAQLAHLSNIYQN